MRPSRAGAIPTISKRGSGGQIWYETTVHDHVRIFHQQGFSLRALEPDHAGAALARRWPSRAVRAGVAQSAAMIGPLPYDLMIVTADDGARDIKAITRPLTTQAARHAAHSRGAAAAGRQGSRRALRPTRKTSAVSPRAEPGRGGQHEGVVQLVQGRHVSLTPPLGRTGGLTGDRGRVTATTDLWLVTH